MRTGEGGKAESTSVSSASGSPRDFERNPFRSFDRASPGNSAAGRVEFQAPAVSNLASRVRPGGFIALFPVSALCVQPTD